MIIKLQYIIFTTINGHGNLKINRDIRQLTKTLYSDYGVYYDELRNEFFFHCLERVLLEKYDEKKSKLRTYITTSCRNFLIDKVRKLERYRRYFEYIESIGEEKLTGITVALFPDLYRQDTPERDYLRKELWLLVKEFMDKYDYSHTHGYIFLSLLVEWIDMTELAEIWEYSLEDIANGHKIFKRRLKKYLNKNG